jgi:hypothetical protein
MTKTGIALLCLGALCCAPGCGLFSGLVGAQIVVKTQTQSLREQVLGYYADLGKEVYILAGVRSIDPVSGQPKAPPRMTASERRALEARRSIEFDRDDVLAFKQAGYLGEGRDGSLVFFADQQEKLKSEAPWLYGLVRDVTQQENRDRLAVMQRIIEITPELQGEEGPEMLRAILAEKYRQEAGPGMKVQRADGTWETKGP